MKHNYVIEGAAYRLRPVKIDDAHTIIMIRLEDQQRNKYINKINDDVEVQEKWIENYYHQHDDYYFVIENSLTGDAEGLIGIYDIKNGKGEWGRWVIKKTSLAATESLDLIFKAAFDHIGLSEIYCRTIKDNTSVVSFHDSTNQLRRGEIKNHTRIEDNTYDVVEHYVTNSHYYNNIRDVLEKKSNLLFSRNLKKIFGDMSFHHIGVATESIEKEYNVYRLFGYIREDSVFEDETQGIRGQFIISDKGPRLELLENLPQRNTLDRWIEGNIKNYHFAYKIKNFDEVFNSLKLKKVRAITRPEISTYFKKRICFFVLPNKFMIEFIEE